MISITDELQGYLHSKSYRYITLKKEMKKVCCASPPIPMVKIGRPKDIEDYHIETINDIQIYVHKGLQYRRPYLNVGLRKFFRFYEVYAYDPESICFCSGEKGHL
ncbi:MAG: CC/Se motif family (seleno)protein [Thermotaleaceae bacterium]